MNKFAVKLTNLSKKYVLHHEKPTLAEKLIFRKYNKEFWALKNINLNIRQGERIGIIGRNGSGKTTLLKIISSITSPTKGRVTVNGKTVSLIDVNAGFHPDLTGEENIYLNGLLMGMSKHEIQFKTAKIIAFANIGKFINSPFYTYSEGMKLRLGFSVSIHASPDILVLDEPIVVGDRKFQKKSLDKIQEFTNDGKTILYVSHNLDPIRKHSSRVVWLEAGKLQEIGAPSRVIQKYIRFLNGGK